MTLVRRFTTSRGEDTSAARLLRASLPSLVAKALALPITGIAAFCSVRTVVDALGVPGYAVVAAVTALPALLRAAGSGVGAAFLDAVAGSKGTPGDRRHIEETAVAGARTLICAGMLITVVGLVLVGTGAHASMLGSVHASGAGACILAAAVLFGCSLPLSLGDTALAATNRNHLATLLQAAGSALAPCLLLICAALRLPAFLFVSATLLGPCAAGAVSLLIAGRALRMPLLRIVVTSLRPRQRSTRIIQLAGPMTVINATMGVAYGTDRLVLGHAADAGAVAVYSAGAQLYAPASALISAAALPLWGLFVRQRCDSSTVPRGQLLQLTAWFTAGALLIGAVLVTAGPPVSDWMTHGRAGADSGLMTAFAALITVHAVAYPVNMWLTDPASLRFQATRCVTMALFNLVFSVPLAKAIGPAVPVTASVASYAICIIISCFRRAFWPR